MSSDAVKHSIIYKILRHYLSAHGGLDYVAFVYARGAEVMEPRMEITRGKIAHALRRLALGRERTAEQQVDLWRGLIPIIHSALCALDKHFLKVGQGENVRVLFDIDMGGYFYTRVGGHGFVFGATLDQAEVNSRKCEEEMRSMVAEIEAVCTAYGA